MPDGFVVGVRFFLTRWAEGGLDVCVRKVEGLVDESNMETQGLCAFEDLGALRALDFCWGKRRSQLNLSRPESFNLEFLEPVKIGIGSLVLEN